MSGRKSATRAERDGALALLRARLTNVEQGASRALGVVVGIEAEETRAVYASYISWLKDRICEVEAWVVLDETG